MKTRARARLVERSGFFDPAWYLDAHPDVWLARYPPSHHYLRYGRREGRNPGPLFDGRWYAAGHPDVSGAGGNPLLHFLRSSPGEGRTARSLAVPPPPGRQNLTVELPIDVRPPGTIVVMVHAYYADVFDQLCEALRSTPCPFTLLVSVPTDVGRDEALASIRRHRLPTDAQVRVFPNRGRNFAPFVAGFADEIARHDIVLHLHTKKSLFTGGEQALWRDQLVDSLVGSPAMVKAVFQLFAQQPDVGIVYPATTTTLPYWAHHWLANSHLAHGLFDRLGIAERPGRGYVEYPVGGMFWARVEAIRPVLAAGFTFDDFPDEAGQTDGTLAHAIERCFVPLARSRRYGFVEFDRPTGAFRLNWGTKNLEQYQALSVAGLRQAVTDADLVSFDIFDTIVTRLAVEPDAVMRATGQHLDRQHPDADNFFVRRKQAEDRVRVRQSGLGDASLADIAEAFAKDEGWSDELVALALATEVERDLATMTPRAAIVDAVHLARQLGKRVIAVSDTYYGRPEIDRILRSAGVHDCFDEVYLSSEVGARKDRGDLWQHVLDKEAVPVDRWLHVGDNERSDVQAAFDRGLRTYHCMNPNTLLGLRGLRSLAPSDPGSWGTHLLLGPVAARLGNDPFLDGDQYRPPPITDAHDVGYCVFGPVAMAFLAWMARHPALPDVDHLYFLSREGHLLRVLWEKIRATAPELPGSTYLLVSRRSVLAPAQSQAFDADQVVHGHGFNGTVGELLASRLGLPLPPGNQFADLRLQLPDDDVMATKVVDEPRDAIIAHGAAELPHMLEYLHAVGLASEASEASAAVVDIGYSATIQRHLQTLTGRGLTGFYMGTMAKAAEVGAAGGSAFGCFEENVPTWTPESAFHRHSIVLEAFLTAPQGQVERVEIAGGRAIHHLRQEHRTISELQIVEDMHAGALRYCDDLLGAYGRVVIDAPTDLTAILDLVTQFATGEIASADVLPNLVVDDDYCGLPRRPVLLTPTEGTRGDG